MVSQEPRRSRSLVLITPIKQGFVPGSRAALRYHDRLKAILEGITARKQRGEPNALDLIDLVHFGQWSIIDGGQRLLFVSMYVGELEPYLKDFSVRVAWGLDLIWTHCEGYPRAANFEKFLAWVKGHMVQADCFYASNPDVTVADIKWWKSFHRKFEEFRREVHCGAEIGPRFAALERAISNLSADEERRAQEQLIEPLVRSVRSTMEDLIQNGLYTPEEIEAIQRDFERLMASLQEGRGQ